MEYLQVSESIHLDQVNLSMAPAIFNVINRDREYLREWLPFVDVTHKVSDTELFIKSLNAGTGFKKDVVYAIWFKMEFAGLIGFKDTDWVNNKTELGYWLAQDMQGKGIITQCVYVLIRHAFGKLNMNRVQVKVAAGNSKSAAIPERLGFKFEGIERQGELINGLYHDLLIFSILKTDDLTHGY
ncbi:MAG TPA: GNAT family protein [Mariniphaga sp.]|nr:GNAT family protein [Mariniphaga sp.]